jgi:hypothetical protein
MGQANLWRLTEAQRQQIAAVLQLIGERKEEALAQVDGTYALHRA